MSESWKDDERKLALLEWLTTVPAERTLTKGQLADQLGVATRTLRDWQAQEDFRKEWDKRAWDISGGPEKTQLILEALAEYATDREAKDRVSAANVWLKATGAISPTARQVAEPQGSKGAAAELTEEQLTALLMERMGTGAP